MKTQKTSDLRLKMAENGGFSSLAYRYIPNEKTAKAVSKSILVAGAG